jgi:hypothetical protein
MISDVDAVINITVGNANAPEKTMLAARVHNSKQKTQQVIN